MKYLVESDREGDKAVCCNLCFCSRKQRFLFCGISSLILLVVIGFVLTVLIKALTVEERFQRLVLEDSPRLLHPTKEEKQTWAEKLGEAIKIQTVSTSEDQLSFPELLELHSYLKSAFPKVFNSPFVEVTTVNNYSLLLEVTGSNPTGDVYMIAAHLDVVPAGDTSQWDHPPFLGEVIDQGGVNYVYGRGAIDDKHNLIGILEALNQILVDGGQPDLSFYIAFGHDEEVSGHQGAGHIAGVMEHRLQQNNQTLQFIIDEGMFVSTGLFPGMDDAVINIGVAEKGWATVELEAKGGQGHSSFPPKQTAIGVLGAAIANLEGNPHPAMFKRGPEYDSMEFLAPHANFQTKIALSNLWLFSPLVSAIFAGDPTKDALQRTTTAVTMVSGGIKENVLPPSAKATVNHRIHVSSNLEETLRHDVEAINDDRVTVRSKGYFPPSPVSDFADSSTPFQIIANSALQIYPGGHITPGVLIANTDCRHYLHLSDNIYRFSPVHLRANDTRRFHGANERISVDNFAEVVGFYYRLIKNSDIYLQQDSGRAKATNKLRQGESALVKVLQGNSEQQLDEEGSGSESSYFLTAEDTGDLELITESGDLVTPSTGEF